MEYALKNGLHKDLTKSNNKENKQKKCATRYYRSCKTRVANSCSSEKEPLRERLVLMPYNPSNFL